MKYVIYSTENFKVLSSHNSVYDLETTYDMLSLVHNCTYDFTDDYLLTVYNALHKIYCNELTNWSIEDYEN